MNVAVTAPVRLANLGARGLFSLSSAVRTYAHLQRFCPFTRWRCCTLRRGRMLSARWHVLFVT